MPVTDIIKDIENRTLIITAEFAAPLERVWGLYADPRQLEQVCEALAKVPPRDRSAEQGLIRELERIRELLVSGEEQKDHQALLEQWDRGSALLRQLRASGEAPEVDKRRNGMGTNDL